MESTSRWGWLVLLASLSGCSFSNDREFSRVSIEVPAVPKRYAPLMPFPSLSLVEPPVLAEDFDCLAINVMGSGIRPTWGNPGDEGRLAGVLAGSSCGYAGVSAIVENRSTDRVVDLKVPSGARRVIQVAGMMVPPGSTFCGRPRIDQSFDGSGVHFFEIGRAIVDLFKDAKVSIREEWDSLDSQRQLERRADCGNENVNYASLIENVGSLVGYWKMNEDSGASFAADSKGGYGDLIVQAGTDMGAVSAPVGIGQRAMSITSTASGRLFKGAGHAFASQDFTLEIWVRFTGCETNSLFLNLRDQYADDIIRLECKAPGKISFRVQSSPEDYAVDSTSIAYNDGAWHHLVGVKEGGFIRLYVDGAQAAAPIPVSYTAPDFSFSSVPVVDIGFDGMFTLSQPGDYAHAAIYDGVLSDMQILQHYNVGR